MALRLNGPILCGQSVDAPAMPSGYVPLVKGVNFNPVGRKRGKEIVVCIACCDSTQCLPLNVTVLTVVAETMYKDKSSSRRSVCL